MTLARPPGAPPSGSTGPLALMPGPVARTLPVALAGATVLAQVAYPLTPDAALAGLTVATVLLFSAAMLTHAVVWRGHRAARALLAVGVLALLAEAVGVATGVPFGSYEYGRSLGSQVLGVPVVVALAWTMMAYPTLLAARAVCRGRPSLTVPLAALGLVGWDLYLDPQMVAAGHWVWHDPNPHLPGMDGIPLTNMAGWVLVALLVQAVLHRLLPAPRPGLHELMVAPAVLLAWTWLGSALAHGVFWGRPGVAVWGLLAMAPLVVPALLVWWRERT